MSFEREYRDLIHVPRWAIARTTRTQSVAEHSYFVALYTSFIFDWMQYSKDTYMPINASQQKDILVYALKHDRSEAYMSDIPGPVKRNIRDKEKMDEYERQMDYTVYGDVAHVGDDAKMIVKIADLMEEYAFWYDEKLMGNQMADDLLPMIYTRLQKSASSLDPFNPEYGARLVDAFMSGLVTKKVFPHNDTDLAA